MATGIGLFGGISLAVALADGAALQGILMFVLGLVGAVSGWKMLSIGQGIFLRDKKCVQTFLTAGSLWVILGVLGGALTSALWMVGGLLLCGILLSWGGRRTALGRQVQMQTVGFARYLRTVEYIALRRKHSVDPEYFFRMAPAVLALGREKRFAKGFGDVRLDRCPYLTTGMDGHRTAGALCS